MELYSLFRVITKYNGIFLFSSHIPGGKNILGLNPILKITEGSLQYQTKDEEIGNPFEIMDSIAVKVNEITGHQTGDAGFLGYVSYDYKDRLEEDHLYLNIRQEMLPDIYFALFEHYLFFQTGSRRITLITLQPSFRYSSVDSAPILEQLVKPVDLDVTQKKSVYSGTSLSKKEYEAAVQRTIKYIKSGDIYQANITRAIYGETEFTPEELGYLLYHSNRIEFGVFACINEKYIISTSPERFFKINHNKILTSPIKGTISRISHGKINRINKRELLTSEKDLAELAMIVDLLRNDISKICRQGSVKVKGFPVLKELFNVYHLAADIEGTLLDDVKFREIICAIFPGGSISGCPKIRACQIIEELEKEGRGLYTGSFGYYSFKRRMDFNIMIRSLFLNGSSFVFNVGGGITLLSDPEKEYEETIHKAKNIWDALRMEEIYEERYCFLKEKKGKS